MFAYHGTNSDFQAFNKSFLGLNTKETASDDACFQTSLLGFWFSSSTEGPAANYERVITCEIELNNPLYIDDLASLINWLECVGLEDVNNYLDNNNHDGIIIQSDEEFGASSFVVRDSTQIAIL